MELEVRQQSHGRKTQLVLSVANEIGEAGLPDPGRLFERFYRSEAARSQSGAGLGLWLSQSLARALGSVIVWERDENLIRFNLVLELDAA